MCAAPSPRGTFDVASVRQAAVSCGSGAPLTLLSLQSTTWKMGVETCPGKVKTRGEGRRAARRKDGAEETGGETGGDGGRQGGDGERGGVEGTDCVS